MRRKALIAKSASKFGAPGVVRGRHGQSAGDVRWGREDKKSGNGEQAAARNCRGRLGPTEGTARLRSQGPQGSDGEGALLLLPR